MSLSAADTPFVLYVYPGAWNVPSVDPACLSAILFLRLTVPGRFALVECTAPEVSPSGQLPLLKHDDSLISPLPAIISYLSKLPAREKDDVLELPSLPAAERASRLAWCAHVETNMGNFVAHMLFSLNSNYWAVTRPTLASSLPFPQRHYIPDRVREAYRPRLAAAELWGIPEPESEDDGPRASWQRKSAEQMAAENKHESQHRIKRVFEREKVLDKARATLDIYARLLGERSYFYNERPTTLDAMLAAHVLLLLEPPFRDPLLQTLLKENYPTLVAHARRVQSYCIPDSSSLHRAPPILASPLQALQFPLGPITGGFALLAAIFSAAGVGAWYMLNSVGIGNESEDVVDSLGREMDDEITGRTPGRTRSTERSTRMV